ncbi:hypothetical protein V6N13_008678 [Hibiscus sabdariffa]
MVGRRARKSMSGAANDSTTKFPILGKVSLEWLMHRLASPSPGHAQSVGVFVTPGRPTTRGFGLVDARSRWLCAVGGSKTIRYRPCLNHKRCRPGIGGCCF